MRIEGSVRRYLFALMCASVLVSMVVMCQCGGSQLPVSGRKVVLKVGMQEEPSTLNILNYQSVWSGYVLGRFYRTLYDEGPVDFEMVPILAESLPQYDAATTSCIVRLRRGITWDDGVPFTAADVVFTANMHLQIKIPSLYYAAWEFIDRVEALNDYTVKFVLKTPRATFFSNTLMPDNFILPRHRWAPVVEDVKHTADPVGNLMEYQPDVPVGLGPFRFVEWRRGSYIKVVSNPNFYGRGLKLKGLEFGPFMDEILYKIYRNTDTAILALKKGDIDYIWWPIQPGYLDELKGHPDIAVTSNPANGWKFLAFHCNREPFNDVNFRRACHWLIDKDFLVERVLQGHGQRADNFVPPVNKFWHNPDVPVIGKGMTKAERWREAKAILSNAGYSWTVPPEIHEDGTMTSGKELRMPNGKPLKAFSLLTPTADYDPLRATTGTYIQQWWRKFGIPVTAVPTSINDILRRADPTGDFDIYMLGWIRLPIDPEYLSTLFTSRQAVKDGNNTSCYRNPAYDALAAQADAEMDREARRRIIFRMQEIIIADVPYIPLYAEDVIEAYRKDRFTGWVHEANGIGNPWSILTIKPVQPR